LGIIFLEGLERRLWLQRKGLQRKQPHNKEKAQKKVLNIFADTPVLLPKKAFLMAKRAIVQQRHL
jgi:hypothetical protein